MRFPVPVCSSPLTVSVLAVMAYTVALFTVATYATEGLGFSQTKASNVQAVLAAGQAVGRPLCGFLLDRYGRLNMAGLLSVLAGLSCLVIWMFARSYGVLIFFALVQGLFGGTSPCPIVCGCPADLLLQECCGAPQLPFAPKWADSSTSGRFSAYSGSPSALERSLQSLSPRP